MFDGISPQRQAQIMYGQDARHIPMWMYAQDMGNGGVLFVGASKDRSLLYGSGKTHTYILGELIVRPHFVVASNAFRGHGLTGLATANAMEFIMAEDAQLIADPMGKCVEVMRRYNLAVEDKLNQ